MNLQQLRVAEWFGDCSLGQGVATVRVMEKRELAEALWMGKKEIGQTIDELIELRVIKAVGETEWEIVTDTEWWKVQRRWRTALDRDVGRRRQSMMLRDQHDALVVEDRGLDGMERSWTENVKSSEFAGNAKSPACAVPDNVFELRARIAESLRSTDSVGESPTGSHALEPEASGRIAHQKPRNEQSQWVSHPLESGFRPPVPVGESPTEPRARPHAQHDHDHDDHGTNNMRHDHVPCGVENRAGSLRSPRPTHQCSEMEREIWGEVERLLVTVGTFSKTWKLRIEDFPKAVRAAVGETKMAKAQGRVKTSVGGFLNDQFHRFKAEIYSRKAAGNEHAL